jgi:hypothetical protein
MLVAADDLDERVTVTAQALVAALRHPDPLVCYRARLQEAISAALAGRIAVAEGQIGAASGLAQDLRQPQLALEPMLAGAGLALCRADFATADDVLARLPAEPDPDDPTSGLLATTREVLRYLRAYDAGDIIAATANVFGLVNQLDQLPESPLAQRMQAMWETVIAFNAAFDGDLALAADYHRRATARADLDEARDYVWLIGLSARALLAWRLADRALGERLWHMAAPHVRWNTWNSVGSLGPMHRAAGLAAATLRRWSAAEEHLDAARSRAREWGMPGWEARFTLELAEVRQQGAGRLTPAVIRLAREAMAQAEACGSTKTVSDARTLLSG